MSKAESARIALQACVKPRLRARSVRKLTKITLLLYSLNSDIKINAHQIPFIPSIFHSSSTPLSLTTPGTFTLVLDCTDNPATRHFLNAYAVAMDIPLVSGGAVRAEGTVGIYGLPIKPAHPEEGEERGPCYACIFPPPPPAVVREEPQSELEKDLEAQRVSLAGTGACADEGVLGINCGVVGLGMAAEAVKVILGIGEFHRHLLSTVCID